MTLINEDTKWNMIYQVLLTHSPRKRHSFPPHWHVVDHTRTRLAFLATDGDYWLKYLSLNPATVEVTVTNLNTGEVKNVKKTDTPGLGIDQLEAKRTIMYQVLLTHVPGRHLSFKLPWDVQWHKVDETRRAYLATDGDYWLNYLPINPDTVEVTVTNLSTGEVANVKKPAGCLENFTILLKDIIHKYFQGS